MAKSGGEEILRTLENAGIDVVALDLAESKYGAVETRKESRRCAELFVRNRERIDGIVISLPTFGEERAIADVLRLCDLRVPVLMQATPDDTDDTSGKMRGYVGEGRFTDDPLSTFGGAGVVEIQHMQKLLHYICANGFEHHVAANLSTVASSVHEAPTRYLGWDMYWHGCQNGVS